MHTPLDDILRRSTTPLLAIQLVKTGGVLERHDLAVARVPGQKPCAACQPSFYHCGCLGRRTVRRVINAIEGLVEKIFRALIVVWLDVPEAVVVVVEGVRRIPAVAAGGRVVCFVVEVFRTPASICQLSWIEGRYLLEALGAINGCCGN